LGDPDEIIDSERHDAGHGRTIHEWTAILLVLLGGLIAGVGWFLGVALLWSSRAWTTSEKLLGTFVIPGGLGLWPAWAIVMHRVVWGGSSASPSAPLEAVFYALMFALFTGPIMTAVFLARRAQPAARPNR
jgi:hypothetical protein